MLITSAYTLRTYTAGVSNVFSTRLSNELRFNYSSNVTTNNTSIDAFGGSTPVDLAQLTGLSARSEPGVGFLYGGYVASAPSGTGVWHAETVEFG